jgi:hypothetical protein
MAEFAYNNHHHPLIGMTLFFTNFGYYPTLMNIPMAAQSDALDDQIQRIQETQVECRRAIEWSQEISKRAYDKWRCDNPGFEVGDSVWLEATNLVTDEPSPKLTSKQHRPFQILDRLSDLTYHLELPPHWKIHNIFHINVLSKAKPDTILN